MAAVEDLQVYVEGSNVKVRGQITGKIVEEGALNEAGSTIQSTVDRLAEEGGGEIRLSRGFFPLEREIRLASRILLRGSGRGTVLQLSGENKSGVGLYCKGCEGIAIGDLTILADQESKSDAGLILDDCGDSEVRNIHAKGFSKYGIWVRNNSFLCKVAGSNVSGNEVANIYLERLEHGGRCGDYVPNLVTNCITYGGGNGIELKRVVVANILGCAVFQPRGHGYYIHDRSNSVIVSGCRSFQCEKNAVLVESSHEINISSNIFCWQRGHGIELSSVTWGAINGNEVIDSGVRHDPPTIGIWLHNGTRLVQAVGNTVFNWFDQQPMSVGIKEEEGCDKNIFIGNIINYYTDSEIESHGRNTIVEKNLGDHMGFDPEQKEPIPFYRMWHAMGPFEKNQVRRTPEYSRMRLEKFLGGREDAGS